MIADKLKKNIPSSSMSNKLNITIFEDIAMSSALLLRCFEIGTAPSEHCCVNANES